MGLREKITEMTNGVEASNVTTAEELESFRIKFIGSKGAIKSLYQELKSVPNEEKKEFGQLINSLKNGAESKFSDLKASLSTANVGKSDDFVDMTRPADEIALGSRHPLAIIRNEIIEIFGRIGFSVSEGPEIEDD